MKSYSIQYQIYECKRFWTTKMPTNNFRCIPLIFERFGFRHKRCSSLRTHSTHRLTMFREKETNHNLKQAVLECFLHKLSHSLKSSSSGLCSIHDRFSSALSIDPSKRDVGRFWRSGLLFEKMAVDSVHVVLFARLLYHVKDFDDL